MKKRLLCVLFALCLAMPAAAWAEETDETEAAQESLYSAYSIYSNANTDETLELLTLDDAIEKALKNDTTVKTSSNTIDYLENMGEIYYAIESSSSGVNFSNLLSMINRQTNLRNTKISKLAREESVKHSIKEAYAGIIEAERELNQAKKQLIASQLSYNVTKVKASYGKSSEYELKQAQSQIDQAENNIETLEKSLESDYVSLNILMGTDTSKRYRFEMELEYEPLDFTGNIETYAKTMASKSATVRQGENSYAYQVSSARITKATSTEIGAYQQAENSLAEAQMSLQDTKDNIYNQVISLYNQILANEKSYDTYVKQLELAQDNYEQMKIKYAAGKASYLEFITAQSDAAAAENNVVKTIYSHMLLLEQFTNADML